jgi:hypothetical protein
MAAVNPVPGGQIGGSALAGLAATPTAASVGDEQPAGDAQKPLPNARRRSRNSRSACRVRAVTPEQVSTLR